jgi:hypothetical protein
MVQSFQRSELPVTAVHVRAVKELDHLGTGPTKSQIGQSRAVRGHNRLRGVEGTDLVGAEAGRFVGIDNQAQTPKTADNANECDREDKLRCCLVAVLTTWGRLENLGWPGS